MFFFFRVLKYILNLNLNFQIIYERVVLKIIKYYLIIKVYLLCFVNKRYIFFLRLEVFQVFL